jgi:hypothetical protein
LNFVASELLDKKACAFFVAADLRTPVFGLNLLGLQTDLLIRATVRG